MNSGKPISVLLADDHVVVRQGLCALLRVDGEFVVVGEARTGREAVELARRLRTDVILMDIAMPVLNGLEATRQILAANPHARVIILSAHTDDVYVEHISRAGVAGFLEKQTSAEVLATALRAAAEGKTFFSPSIARRLRTDPRREGNPQLTSRETEVLQLVAEGRANKQVAAELGISIKTVEKHRQHLMDKLGLHDTASLTRHAIAQGIVENSVQVTIR